MTTNKPMWKKTAGLLPTVALACAALAAYAEDKPIAIAGFGTDVRSMVTDVMKPCRYVYEVFSDKWIEPKDFGKYAVVYYGEKLDGEARGKGWKDEETRAAITKYLDEGGVVVVAGEFCLRQLMGFENKKKPDPLRARIHQFKRLIGRTKANYSKAGKKLGYADEVGNYILTPEGQEVRQIADEYKALFESVKGVKKVPIEGKWDTKPLGAPGTLTYPEKLPNRPVLGKPTARPDGLVLLDGATKATIALGSCGEAVRKLAEELAWHLEKMSEAKFDVVEDEPAQGPALVYRVLPHPKDFKRGSEAYFKIWREGDKVVLGGDDTGLSRATTYVLEALGCRYVWPGESGKIIPKKSRVVLPEIAVEDATPFVVRRIRLYGRPAWRDAPENRDFYAWHGMNDMRFMTSDRPSHADGYEWGHYYGDYYRKYYKTHRDWFALQPDGTRTLNIEGAPSRPTFCLSNPELAHVTAERIKEKFRTSPEKKCLSICLPDGATATQCMCEECRRLDPVNAAKSDIIVFFPSRHLVPYVASTDRVFTFMSRIAEAVSKEFPDKLLACYAYGNYTTPPVKTVPNKNLMILSVAGIYDMERNIAAWRSFGNNILWRPNAHGGFYVTVPDNTGRRLFDNVSLLAENGVFGVDYDTMSSEWATKPFMYYMACKAHFNPDRLDFDSLADDYCMAGFGAGWKSVREYFDLVEKACEKAHEESLKAPPPITWDQRVQHRLRLPNSTDYDALDRCIAAARAATEGDAAIKFRLDRLQFGTDLGRWAKKLLSKTATPEEREAYKKFLADYLAKDPAAYPADHPRLKM